MAIDEIYEALTDIFRDFFADASIVLKPEMVASDVEGWDSVSNVSLLIATESRFAIKFQTEEMENLACVGDLVSLIERKISP